MEINLNAVDEELKGIKVSAKPDRKLEDKTAEDDIAIAEAIAEVEEELEEEEFRENPSIWAVDLNVGKEETDDDKNKTPDEIAIEKAVMQVEKELADEQFRENPSIWDMSPDLAPTNTDPVDEDKYKTPDELAIEKAIAQVEKELAEEQFRENPSIWDLNPELPVAGSSSDSSIWEVNLRAIDDDLKGIKPTHRRGASGADNYTAEDDVAISEAITQVERELQKEKNSENSIWFIGAAVIGGLVISKALSAWFTKNA